MRKELYRALRDGVPDVNNRVFPIIMPQDTKHNSIVYTFIGNHDTTSVSCSEPIDTESFVQIDIFAKTYAESVDLLEKVKAILYDKFIVYSINTIEFYENLSVKYRQSLNVHIKLKQTY